MKKITFLALLICLVSILRVGAQCNCPPMNMYVYDTKMDFVIHQSSNAKEAGDYLEAKNSGEWLNGAYLKQQSDEFKVYKGMAPGAKTGTTYQPPPDDGSSPGSNIDFTSYVEINRSGNPGTYAYSVTLKIIDIHKGSPVTTINRSLTDLGRIDPTIDAMIASLGPVPDKLRNYEKKLRDQSNGDKWISVKYKSQADKTTLKIHEKTTVTIEIFDCADNKPVANKDVKIKLSDPNVGSLDKQEVKTNDAGDATVTFTAKNNGETRVFPDMSFTDIWDHSGKHATTCSDQKDITVADATYEVKMEAEVTGPSGIHYKLSGKSTTTLVFFADSTFALRPTDGSRNMHITVEAAGVEGKMELKTPRSYDIHFTLNTGNLGKTLNRTAPAKIAIENFSPEDKGSHVIPEVYLVQGHEMVLPSNINANFSGAFMKDFMNTAQESGAKAQQDMDFLKRVQANQNNPAYFQTAQGKADMLALQKMSQENGHGYSASYGVPSQKGPASNVVGGVIGTQTNPGAYGTGPNAGTPTVMGGMFHADGTFSPQSGTAMTINKDSTVGELHGTITITVTKVN